ncbi:MBOAT family O-acyltransferase [Stutzerimonas xanthomarina]|uniref:Probable alginate O-acetylase n=2 Tax=Stutzerimonas xanthomarina TaxID=271420 RepID=A0A1M5MER3_9GAMM|nr:MBOAT family O-acyltransferase [Stutzerimonas xanthomarina]MCP9338960.1 MBOAT family protein [Stutzerimonas xanthomarina]SEH90282.1 D-alanyl-lipoteichoic acid acyltransferase DltB, MBOAT superfamily [Stutzerimonas xanthomarina]SHG75795.1 D-alanyl-lipoteichoic acid acyltransferase DltB, MBOAT superfamily [Stutzerimonas xanthomarina DSM 18231]
MLFNSMVFIAGFLPVVLLGFILLAGTGRQRYAAIWLTLASLVFYGWWNPAYVPLLVGSMVGNYLAGGYLMRQPSRSVLVLGVAANVGLLAYYKYTGFLFGTLDDAFGLGWSVGDIILPLAISFFTFQQIAYLIDAHDGEVNEHDFVNYCLFISFFPQLIAGPITHHGEMLKQFNDRSSFRPRIDNISLGLTVFVLGLFKKVILADPLGENASPIFAVAASGTVPSLYDAWYGALSYTLQIYFDFSGYSDMAIGLGLLFGLRLPVNFNSPFKAHNIIDYWSRWHMTLTRFLTAYIYNPIVIRITRSRMAAGKPLPRRGKMSLGTFVVLIAYPTVLTMFISGVWHGAGWQFVAFGLLHGFYLVVAHGFRAYKARRGLPLDSDKLWHHAGAVLLTFLCVVVAMVFFRANSVTAAMAMLTGMAGLSELHTDFDKSNYLTVAILLAFVWIMPNVQQWMASFRIALDAQPRENWLLRWFPIAVWSPTPVIGLAIGVLGFFALAVAFSVAPTEFLYFQF